MNLKEIIEATLIELDRGTETDTVNMHIKKFTAYANEAVDEIARRFQACKMAFPTLVNDYGVVGFHVLMSDSENSAFQRKCKRIVRVMKVNNAEERHPCFDKKPYYFTQPVRGDSFIRVIDDDAKAGDMVAVEYLYVPKPMPPVFEDPDNAGTYISPDLPEYLHSLIPLYVRAREQCGQDPSTQGTSSAYFSLFNQKVYQLQRETLATPESFQFKNYHFE